MAKVIYDVKKQAFGNLIVFDMVTFEGSDDEVNQHIKDKVKDYDNFIRVQDIDFDNHVVRIDQIVNPTAKKPIQKVYVGQFNQMLESLNGN